MDQLEAMPVGADHIADWTASDPVLQQVLRKVQHGVGSKSPEKSLEPHNVRRDELNTQLIHIVGKLCGHISKRSTTASGGLAC